MDTEGSDKQDQAVARLAQFFRRSGYVRVAKEALRRERGQAYHKGYALRSVVDSARELEPIRQLLAEAGFKPAQPFQKHSRTVQPVYGRRIVELFLPLTQPQFIDYQRRRG